MCFSIVLSKHLSIECKSNRDTHLEYHTKMTTLLKVLVLCLAVGTLSADDCHWTNIMGCGINVMSLMGDVKGSIPIDEGGIDKQCFALKDSAECMQNYTQKCLPKAMRDMMTSVQTHPDGQSDQKLLEDYCTKGAPLRTKYLASAPCLREAAVSDPTKKCLDDVLSSLEKAETPGIDVFALTCCTVNRFEQCCRQSVKDKCGAETEDLSNFVVVRSRMYALGKRMCSCMDEGSVSCDAVLPPRGTPPTGKKPRNPLGLLYNRIENWKKQ